jgi:hypothetical protein
MTEMRIIQQRAGSQVLLACYLSIYKYMKEAGMKRL